MLDHALQINDSNHHRCMLDHALQINDSNHHRCMLDSLLSFGRPHYRSLGRHLLHDDGSLTCVQVSSSVETRNGNVPSGEYRAYSMTYNIFRDCAVTRDRGRHPWSPFSVISLSPSVTALVVSVVRSPRSPPSVTVGLRGHRQPLQSLPTISVVEASSIYHRPSSVITSTGSPYAASQDLQITE